MQELEPRPQPPYRISETIDENGHRIRIVDANTPAAERLNVEEFWQPILEEDGDFLLPELSLKRFFGKESSPDELIVVLPLRNTSDVTSVKAMHAACWNSHSATSSVHGDLYMAALLQEDDTHDTLISVGISDWASTVPLHDGKEKEGAFTVFRAHKAKVPKSFIYDPFTGPSANLSAEQWGALRKGLEETQQLDAAE